MKKLIIIWILFLFAGINCLTYSQCNVSFTYMSNGPGMFTFTNTTSSPSIPGQYIVWDFGNGSTATGNSITYNYQISGTYVVCMSYWDSLGCQGNYCDTITVQTNSNCFNFGATFSNSINGNTVSFISNVFGGTAPYNYYWDFGDGDTSTLMSPSHTYNNPGTYVVSLIATDSIGCTYTAYNTIVINAPPCTSNEVILTIQFDNFASETSWDLVDSIGNVIASGNNYTSSQNGATLSQTLCLQTGCYTFTIYDSFGDGICCGFGQGYYQLTDVSTNTVLSSGGTFTFADASSFCVGGASNPCNNLSSSFSYNTNGNTVSFTSNTMGGTGPYLYNWTFGDGGSSTQANPAYTYNSGGLYIVSLLVTDASGCTYIYDDSLHLSASPCTSNEVILTLSLDNYPFETSWDLVDSSGSIVAIGGNYSSNQNASTITQVFCLPSGCYTFNIYDSYGDGICCLYGQGSYQLTDNSSSTILASGGAFGYSESSIICVGGATHPCSNFVTSFNHSTAGNIVTFNANSISGVTYSWDFGDNTTATGTNPTHTYANTTPMGYYIVCLTATDSLGCTVTYCDTVPVAAAPCNTNLVTLTLNFDNFAYETSWAITNANGQYVAAGNGYTQADNGTSLYINLCLPMGCYDLNIFDTYGDGICCGWGNGSYSLTDTNGTVLAGGGQFNYLDHTNFCVGGATNPCGNFSVNITDSSITNGPNTIVMLNANISGGTAPFSYSWTPSTVLSCTNCPNPIANFNSNGYYTACVTVTDVNGCSTVQCHSFLVNSINNGSPCNGLSVDMNFIQDTIDPFLLYMQPVLNNALPNTNYYFVWDFGDNTGAFSGYPVHQYNNWGSYIVCITALDSMNGCIASFCDTITIDSLGNFSRDNDYKSTKPGFIISTQPPIINFFTNLDVKQNNSISINLFPNPTTDVINLEVANNVEIDGSISVYDITGRIINKYKFKEGIGYHVKKIPIDKLSSGVYLINLTSQSFHQSVKFIKE
ncbi:MAG: PKD domain-containing protein [Saprospiraceae bacterium]|nr:PKD domain-containing protein [Saprospiraceae bacterium]